MAFIFELLAGVVKSSFQLLMDMAPYLFFGFLFAGILNEFISAEKIARHLGKNSVGSVLKAALFGIPLPLCSCGVIPPTMTLRKSGAGRGAVLSFLIATPTSGVDSIFATYSLLGPFFAIYRVIASFIAAVFAGIVANIGEEKTEVKISAKDSDNTAGVRKNLLQKIFAVFEYAFVELLGEIGKWLVLGLLIGGIIMYALPDQFFEQYLNSGWQGILAMLIVGIPLYVCATGSIPIAAALMLKGMNPGAAFVFLLAGPATNAVTLTVVGRFLGRKTVFVYLLAIVLSSVGLGLLLDVLWVRFNPVTGAGLHLGHKLLPVWLEYSTAIFLLAVLLAHYAKKYRGRIMKEKIVESTDSSVILDVPDMTCNHCAMSVTKAVQNLDGIFSVDVDLSGKKVNVRHGDGVTSSEITRAVEDAGYQVKNR